MNDTLPSLIPEAYLQNMAAIAATCPPEGIFVEVGVFRGGSAQRLYNVAQDQGRALHLFDTFTGMPYVGDHDHGNFVGEFADGANFLDRIRATLPNAHIHVGIFPATLPKNLPPIAFIHADGDIEQTTKDILDRLWPLVIPGGAILFDDYPFTNGCKKAVGDFFQQYPELRPHMHLVPHGLLRKPE